jgi:hypothetical protein
MIEEWKPSEMHVLQESMEIQRLHLLNLRGNRASTRHLPPRLRRSRPPIFHKQILEDIAPLIATTRILRQAQPYHPGRTQAPVHVVVRATGLRESLAQGCSLRFMITALVSPGLRRLESAAARYRFYVFALSLPSQCQSLVRSRGGRRRTAGALRTHLNSLALAPCRFVNLHTRR